MTFGDCGGTLPQVIITCRAAETISKGDALRLTAEAYDVARVGEGERIFGEAMGPADPGEAFPVAVRGILAFSYAGDAPVVGGAVAASAEAGKVRAAEPGAGIGVVVKVCEERRTIEVLV